MGPRYMPYTLLNGHFASKITKLAVQALVLEDSYNCNEWLFPVYKYRTSSKRCSSDKDMSLTHESSL